MDATPQQQMDPVVDRLVRYAERVGAADANLSHSRYSLDDAQAKRYELERKNEVLKSELERMTRNRDEWVKIAQALQNENNEFMEKEYKAKEKERKAKAAAKKASAKKTTRKSK